ncbi:IMPACT family protein [Gracilimonas mengyeensis]|uniref:Uncharacterized protein, YigZ family n=1 Tax=Gracilimonas mengyeensis TaxID=1302730 RepID=A0A521C759_9BACT|nr:YigZ family protein [Gracilimonas mengyeensis]SMO54540.1 uncharacterized protein, YigZ family [Gracilimonas mengyeensis]
MKTITQSYESSFRERGSKFMGYLFPAETEEDFADELDQIKSQYPDATHHCYGWRINPARIREFSSDDGEPSGTAGLPILNQMKSYEVVNAGIVVVRYYGGTKLGKAGLIEAYGRSAELCLDVAKLVTIRPVQFFEVKYPYPEENTINKLKNDFELKVEESEYMEDVTLKIACPKEDAEAFENALKRLVHLNIRFDKKEEHFV